jgi:hypothetical protein
MLTYNYGFQLEDVRKFADEGRIHDPVVVHHSRGYTFFFTLTEKKSILDKCVLITFKGARPREFKKARTYARILKANGINRWRVERREDASI